MPVLQAEAFWQFSLDRYPGCKQPLLRLQDEAGLNVNILLLCLYLQGLGIRLSSHQFCILNEAIQSTESLLGSLRELRRKTGLVDEQAYRCLLNAELALEKQQQIQLCSSLADISSGVPARNERQDNLQCYCLAEGCDPACLQPLLEALAD